MADKTIYIPVSFPEEMMSAGLIAFASAHGWTPDNVLTAEAFGVSYIRKLIREDVKNYMAHSVASDAKEQFIASFDQALEGVEQLPIPPVE